jgi:integrase
MQGHGASARIANVTKNRSAEVREVWSADLIKWLDWRIGEATPEARLRGEVALFPNPTARNRARRWGDQAAREEWNGACGAVGIHVSLGEGTRHCMLTHLSKSLPERELRAFSRHRDGKSLDHYTKPRPTTAVIRRITGGGDG